MTSQLAQALEVSRYGRYLDFEEAPNDAALTAVHLLIYMYIRVTVRENQGWALIAGGGVLCLGYVAANISDYVEVQLYCVYLYYMLYNEGFNTLILNASFAFQTIDAFDPFPS